MHSIDDRLENARKESLSQNFTTRNVQPTSLSCPLVNKGDHALQDKYYIKAMVPVWKQTYR